MSNDRYRQCYACGGDGYLTTYTWKLDGNVAETNRTCDYCHGTGKQLVEITPKAKEQRNKDLDKLVSSFLNGETEVAYYKRRYAEVLAEKLEIEARVNEQPVNSLHGKPVFKGCLGCEYGVCERCDPLHKVRGAMDANAKLLLELGKAKSVVVTLREFELVLEDLLKMLQKAKV